MSCGYCHLPLRKFYCADCMHDKKLKNLQELDTIVPERDSAVAAASTYFEETAYVQQLIAEKNKRANNVEMLRHNQTCLLEECNKKKQMIKDLQDRIKEKRMLLHDAAKRKSQAPKALDNAAVMKHWQRTHKMTVGTRRILVKETTSLFELKPGVVEEPELSMFSAATVNQAAASMADVNSMLHQSVELPPFSPASSSIPMETKEDLYICGVTLPTRLIDVSKYPKEELNAPIGLVIHMLGLIVRYLGIKLPFLIMQKGTRPYIRTIKGSIQLWHSDRKMPLFLEDDDKNFKKFVNGMAMLNYNLAYLCYTQNIKIPVSQTANTLQSLMACCRASDLGIQSHALYYRNLRDVKFPIEFQHVLHATKLRYRCSSSTSNSSTHANNNNNASDLSASRVTSNNELHDDFYRVRSFNSSSSRHDEYDQDEYAGIYIDSDDDSNSQLFSQQQYYEQQQQQLQQQQTSQTETWSLVEVAPFL
ncbi:UV radiation resistance protein and autophagy-related subunit 14-domain-containing protein [Mucor lusitanicus]